MLTLEVMLQSGVLNHETAYVLGSAGGWGGGNWVVLG